MKPDPTTADVTGEQTPPDKSVTVSSPADAARMVAGITLTEAVNLGEINPAMARRYGERMDQLFNALMHGAQLGWSPRGAIVLKWPEEPVELLRNPKQTSSRDRLNALKASAVLPEGASKTGEGEDE